MLRRVIGFLLIVIVDTVFADSGNNVFSDPNVKDAKSQKDKNTEIFNKADEIKKSAGFNEQIGRERKALVNITSSMLESNKINQLPNLGNTEIRDWLDQAVEQSNKSFEVGRNAVEIGPLILVSLSMPDEMLKGLIRENARYRGIIAVRGLIDGDLKKTILKLKSLATENEQGGIAIDPSLFTRFDVKAVPTFILPLERLKECTPDGCPIPRHTKATGDVTLRYFLDMVERTGSDEEKALANDVIERGST